MTTKLITKEAIKLQEYSALAYKKNNDRKTYTRKGPSAKTSIENIDGTVNLSRKTITWEELTRDDFKSVATFSECVTKASGYIHGRRVGRMNIAGLALRACEIRVGGNKKDFKNQEISKKTLTEFAKKLNIRTSTLSEWVQIRRRVVDQLRGVKTVNFTAANLALQKIRRTGGDATKIYEEFLTQDPFEQRGIQICNYLRRAAKSLCSMGVERFTQAQIKEARIHSRAISEALSLSNV